MENDIWSLNPRLLEGETFNAARHRMRMLRIVERKAGCNLCSVEEIGPECDPQTGEPLNVPSLHFGGSWEWFDKVRR